MIHGVTPLTGNRLVARFRAKDGRVLRQGKRLSRQCPVTHKEARAYVERGVTVAIVTIMKQRKISVREADELLHEARFGRY